MTERFYFSKCCGICDNDKGESDFTNMLHSDEVVELLNEQHETIQALKEKLCELGVSDVKYKGKRYDTGLEEWLE